MIDFGTTIFFVIFIISVCLNAVLILVINGLEKSWRKDVARLDSKVSQDRDRWQIYYRHNRKLNAKIKRIVLEQRRLKFAAVSYEDALSAQDALDQIKRETIC